ncbi:MAG: hypothetical protein DRJ09_02945 [Bacteroidetes bacterium]|nr:MAG: hypothetical protein DRJ09_02945 [Bacteroidota bacterium]
MKSFKLVVKYLPVFLVLLVFSSCGVNPEKSGQLLDQGVDYYYHGQYKKAVALFKEALDADDENFEAWFWMGNYFENIRDHIRAIECYTKAIELNRNYADAFANRAKAKKNNRDNAGACADWKMAAKLGKANLHDDLEWCKRNGIK